MEVKPPLKIAVGPEMRVDETEDEDVATGEALLGMFNEIGKKLTTDLCSILNHLLADVDSFLNSCW